MNSSKTKTVDSSALYAGDGGTRRRQWDQRAGSPGQRASSPLRAHNTPDWLWIDDGRRGVLLDKGQSRARPAGFARRLTVPRRQLLQAFAAPQREVWQRLAAAQCRQLGIDWVRQLERGLQPVAEPERLVCHERDAHGRWLWLRADAQHAWTRLRAAAADDAVVVQAVSGWRSIHYQRQLLARKLARGQSMDDILKVSAAPGFSEHHAGTALDLAGPQRLDLDERFEATAAFAWLRENAARFGFVMSLPRGNRFGYLYEPWHWRLG